MQYGLTTTERVKRYLAITSTGQDTLIGDLIPRASRQAERYCSRTFPSVTVTGRRLNGTGTPVLTLAESPIINIDSVSIAGVALTVSDGAGGAGYLFDDTALYLVGAKWPRGLQNVVASWEAGYAAETTDTVPTGNAPQIVPDQLGLALAGTVTDANGVLLTQVSANPGAGQFSLSGGAFTFNAAQANQPVTIAYRYVPAPVEQAVIEMIGMDLKQRDNLGVTAASIANQSITYTDKGMSASVREMLGPYRRVWPG